MKGCFAGLALMLGAGSTQAALITYNVSFTATDLGSLQTALIDSSDIGIGDTYNFTLTLNDQTPMYAKVTESGITSAVFNSPSTNLSATAAPGNTGSFVPTWTTYNSPLRVTNVEGKVQLGFDLRFNGGNSVDYTAGEESPTTGSTAIRFLRLRYDTDLAFDDAAVAGAPLAVFLSPTEGWTVTGINFEFVKPATIASVPTVSGTGTVTAVPEPSTVGLIVLGAAGCLFLRRRCAVLGEDA